MLYEAPCAALCVNLRLGSALRPDPSRFVVLKALYTGSRYLLTRFVILVTDRPSPCNSLMIASSEAVRVNHLPIAVQFNVEVEIGG